MNTNFIRLLFYCIILILVQDLVVDKLPLGTYIYPAIYTLFILLLPFNYSTTASLLWAFFIGLCVDIFSMDIIGLHTAALLAMTYVRPRLLKLVSSKDDMESIAVPSSYNLGMRPFFIYTALSILLYNVILFTLDTFSFHNFFHQVLRILLSTLITTILILFLQYVILPKRR
jgi:rod shape-determining protein MreD